MKLTLSNLRDEIDKQFGIINDNTEDITRTIASNNKEFLGLIAGLLKRIEALENRGADAIGKEVIQ